MQKQQIVGPFHFNDIVYMQAVGPKWVRKICAAFPKSTKLQNRPHMAEKMI